MRPLQWKINLKDGQSERTNTEDESRKDESDAYCRPNCRICKYNPNSALACRNIYSKIRSSTISWPEKIPKATDQTSKGKVCSPSISSQVHGVSREESVHSKSSKVCKFRNSSVYLTNIRSVYYLYMHYACAGHY